MGDKMMVRDYFYVTSAMILLISIAYFSIQTEVVEKVSTVIKYEEPIIIKDTIKVVETKLDTIFEFKSYRDDIAMNGQSIIMNKRYLFNLAEDYVLGNKIRDIMSKGESEFFLVNKNEIHHMFPQYVEDYDPDEYGEIDKYDTGLCPCVMCFEEIDIEQNEPHFPGI